MDFEKLRDMQCMSKKDFLESYSYLTEEDYKELEKQLPDYESRYLLMGCYNTSDRPNVEAIFIGTIEEICKVKKLLDRYNDFSGDNYSDLTEEQQKLVDELAKLSIAVKEDSDWCFEIDYNYIAQPIAY